MMDVDMWVGVQNYVTKIFFKWRFLFQEVKRSKNKKGFVELTL